jgi:hypothetical protein
MAWAQSLATRVEYIGRVEREGVDVHELPLYFQPQGLRTALLQRGAEKSGQSIDELNLTFIVSVSPDMLPHAAKTGVFATLVGGMVLEGARYDIHTQLLEDCRPKELCPPLPPVIFLVVHEPENWRVSTNPDAATRALVTGEQVGSEYPCPVYRTRRRGGEPHEFGQNSNFVMHIGLRALNPSFWALRGCAALLEAST